MFLAFVGLGNHDGGHMTGNGQGPCRILGSHENFGRIRLEQPLHNPLVLPVQRFVIVANAVFQRLHKTLVIDVVQMLLKLLRL